MITIIEEIQYRFDTAIESLLLLGSLDINSQS